MLRQGTSYRLRDTGQGLNRVQVRGLCGFVKWGRGGGCRVALQTLSQEWQKLGWGVRGWEMRKPPTL